MNIRLWIVSALALALGQMAALVAAQPVPPAPQPTTQPPPAPPAAEPPPTQPTYPPPPTEPTYPPPAAEPTYVPPAPPPPPTTTTTITEQPDYPSAPPPQENDAGHFAKGRLALSILAGSSFSGDRTYLILGADLGYFVIDGLEFGAGATFYLFDEPFQLTLSPHVKYVLHMIKTVKPYVGAFYRHYIIAEGIEDQDGLGARLGAYIAPGRAPWYFGIGVAYEHLLGCDSEYWSCDDWYPELTFSIAL